MIVFEIFIPSVALLLITSVMLNRSCKKSHEALLKDVETERCKVNGFIGRGL